MNWYKRAQTNDAGQIILTLLMDAGHGPLKQMEDPDTRLAGYPPEALGGGLAYAMGIIQKQKSGGLSDAQNYVVQRIQQMISGGGQPQQPQKQGLQPLGNPPEQGGVQPLGDIPPLGNVGDAQPQ